MELHDANVLLTGGSRGIGPHIARALLGRGARVTLAARSKDDLEEVRLRLGGDGVAIAPGDVTAGMDRARMVELAEEAFGPIDVLVNNAGIEFVRHFDDLSAEQIRDVVATNLEGPIQLTRLVVPGMLRRRRGHVVNVSSLAGKAAVPFNIVYAATKHGLEGFTLSLRAELRHSGVGASVVSPGYVLGEGMFARHVTHSRPKAGTGTTLRAVAAAVIKAIERDKPDLVASGFLPRLSDLSVAISPQVTEAIAWKIGGYEPMRREAEAHRRAGP
jgi:short-subunit dehydrogenase